MKIKNSMIVVTDMGRSVEFYKKVLELHMIMDFGANKTLTGGLALQTLESWQKFIDTSNISFGSNSFEVYFEMDNTDNIDPTSKITHTKLFKLRFSGASGNNFEVTKNPVFMWV